MAHQDATRARGASAALLAMLVLAPWQARANPTSCSTDLENCNVTKCCKNPKSICYEKNPEYASCHPGGCKKGLHDDDKGEWKTPWSCAVLNRDGCSGPKDNCNVTKCCQDISLTCYEKNKEFAQCTKSCVKGLHAGDTPPWNTPWSCAVMTPGAPSTGAAPPAAPAPAPAPAASAKPAGDDKAAAGASAGGAKGNCGDVFTKCGGQGYTGETCCKNGCNCKKFGIYHSSCQPISGHGHKCEVEIESFARLVEVNDGAAEDEHITGKSVVKMAYVTQTAMALAAAGVVFFVVFSRKARRRSAAERQHMMLEADELEAREVRIE